MKVEIGKLIEINDYIIKHNVKTDHGSSGSPIILLNDFKIIGIHRKGVNEKNKLGSCIKNIIEYINNNEIICKFNIKKDNIGKEIQILYNNNKNNNNYLNKLFYINDLEKYCELYLNNNLRINFCWKYRFEKEGENKIKILAKQLLNDMNCIFNGCQYLNSLDLSNFKTSNVEDMRGMVQSCYSLTSINLSNCFNTSNVKIYELYV